MILPCNCVNAGQDKIHGKGMRVMNALPCPSGREPQVRCTVCLKEHTVPAHLRKR